MASSPEAPYVGPRPFERGSEDRARFFGRDREVREIVSLIVSHPLVLVYAQSGAGKTSLFNTAVWEELERMHVVLLPLARIGGTKPALAAEEIANLYVFSALQSIDPDAGQRELAGLSLADYLRRTRGSEPQTRTLVFDQFEELFTSEVVYELYGDRWQEQQEDFFAQVSQAIGDDPTLRVVFLMRKEYLAELERFVPLLPERLQTRFHLDPLDGDEALAAIEGPLHGTNRSFADGVARNLVNRLLAMRVGPERDVRGRFVEPVQLQVVCRHLWQHLPADATTITETDVQDFGDVDTVLGQFYDEAVHAAASAARVRERRLRARLEHDFITSIGTRGTVLLEDWKRLSAALFELERRHVVHAEFRAGTQWYELTHDRLIDPIRTSNARLRRRLARRLAVGGVLAAVAALVVAAAVLGYGRDDHGAAPLTHEASVQIALEPEVVVGTRPLRITVDAVGGTIAAVGGTATASITSGPGRFVRSVPGSHGVRASCSYAGRRASGSCTVFITSSIPGTTVVSATSKIPLAGSLPMARKTEAWTTWIAAGVKPGITIDPTKQPVRWREKANFKITVTNTGNADLKNGIVESKMAPGCNHHFDKVAAGASRHYDCSGPSTIEDYTNIATVSYRGASKWTASAQVSLKAVRRSIVEAALFASRRRAQIEYSGPKRMQGVLKGIRLPKVPRYEDTSSFVTWTYWQSGAPNPMGGRYDGSGTSDTLIAQGKQTLNPTAGDLAFYGGTKQHPLAVGIYVGHGRVVIHTSDKQSPMNRPVNFSSEKFRPDLPLLEYRTYDLSRGQK